MARGKNPVVDHGIDWIIDEDDNILGYRKPNGEINYFADAQHDANGNLSALNNQDGRRSRIFTGVIAKSAVPISLSGTTSATPLAEIQVPGGLMGLNGGVRVTVYWSMTNNANTKRLLIRWGGVRREVFNLNIASWAAASAMVEITNRGATGSQIANAGGTAESFGQLLGFVTASENTEVDQPIQFVGQLSNAGDTLTIERYTVEYLG